MAKVRMLFKYISDRILAYSNTLLREGPVGVIKRILRFISHLYYIYKARQIKSPKDFLIISGCFLDAPHRYRAIHQKEQLEKQGLSGDIVFFDTTRKSMADLYDIFILYRVPLTDEIRRLIQRVKRQNKLCIFDIDDLLIDEKFVKDRYELKEMTKQERRVYLDGVARQKESLKLCDYAVSSTEIIAHEMKPYVKDVLVNRNSLADHFLELHKRAYEEGRTIKRENPDEVVIGYFSGSKSHNHDFKLVKDVLKNILERHPHVKLLLTGYLSIPEEFKQFKDQIIIKPFVKWDVFPKNIMSCDINIVPSENTYFNNAKSEIKFLEASLLHKPTIASPRDAFKKSISLGKTGFLAETPEEWRKYLEKLISDPNLRRQIGENAYKFTLEHYTTHTIGKNFYHFILKHKAKKVTYYLPSLAISGGIIVALEHLARLQKRGFNVSCLVDNWEGDLKWFGKHAEYIPIIPDLRKPFVMKFDVLVATMWGTAERILDINAQKKFYLVQGKEYLFASEKPFVDRVKATYSSVLAKLTVSTWCQSWLKKEFDQNSVLIPNGIDITLFQKCKKKSFHKPVRILIEGDPQSEHKNVDEAFKIIENLSIPKEVWFVSYHGKPKKWYHYDRFLNRIPRKEMIKLFCKCDILLKTSKLESFSYPPLEMMASGGVSVVAKNPGSDEYIQDGYNALVYSVGNITSACSSISKLITDKKLRNKLITGGVETAKKRDWKYSIDILEKLYKAN